jgi:nicotinamide mononucleotide transporter
MEIFDKFLPSTYFADAFQWLAFGFNLIYVILASRGNIWCWVWGFFGTLFQFIVCFDANLKSDALLQIYYSFSAIYGWLSWQSEPQANSFTVKSIPLSIHALVLLLGISLAIPLAQFWHIAAFRYEDALLTAFSILTTILTARKILESWIYWLVIDFTYIFIYTDRGKPLLALLSIIYFLFSIKGYYTWKKMKAGYWDAGVV